jgi:hypothetical protein
MARLAESLQLCQERGDQLTGTYVLRVQAAIAYERGHYAEARRSTRVG